MYPKEYTSSINIFQKSDEFDAWLIGLKDPIGKTQIGFDETAMQ
jgi:hypothetical protein